MILSKLAVIWDSELVSSLTDKVTENGDTLKIIGASVATTLLAVKLYRLHDDQKLNLKTFKSLTFKLLLRMPGIKGIAEKELSSVDKTISDQFRHIFDEQTFLTSLPSKGLSSDQILSELKNYGAIGKVNWRKGRASGTVYSDANHELTGLMSRVFDETAYTNPLHPDVFPGVNKMEAEIVSMVRKLFSGGPDSCGSLTTGGTESIILAVKAYRDYARAHKGVGRRAEILVPVTAHAAFQKACHLLDIRIRFVDIEEESGKVDMKKMRSAISGDTILLVGSACNYPHGICDDIEAIAKLGVKHDIPVHVDSCLGGFLIAFMAKAGHPIARADFSVEGVTSISADTHKYAFAPKGSSVLLFSSKELRRHQYSVQTDWPGGIYATPTLGGSRCGANIATCWATLLHFGFDGYVEATKKIIDAQRWLKQELKKLEGVEVIGDPQMSVIALKSRDFNIFRLSDKMAEKGWSLNPLQFPSAVHICMTLMHAQKGVKEAFLEDLKHVLKECLETKDAKGDGIGVVYGMAQSLPDRSLVQDIASAYIDGLYSTDWGKGGKGGL